VLNRLPELKVHIIANSLDAARSGAQFQWHSRPERTPS
jgi:hypothetical protein